MEDITITEKFEVYGTDNLRNYAVAKALGYTINQSGMAKRGTKVMRPAIGRNGYLQFVAGARLKDMKILAKLGITDKKAWTVQIHKFHAWLLWGEESLVPGIVVRHLNGDLHNNSAANLKLGTLSDNYYDIPEHIRKARHAAVGKKLRKLDDTQALALKMDRSSGFKIKDLAVKYEISERAVKNILNGDSYNENGRKLSAAKILKNAD